MTNKTSKEAVELLQSSMTGLSEQEAKKRLERDGENKLAEKKKTPIIVKFFKQFADAMIIILLIAAGVSFALAIAEGKLKEEFIEPLLILLIVIINAVMGVVQESKAEKALEALKKLSSGHTRVIRDGVEKVIESSQVVVGDIIVLEAGDFVPADARLIKSSNLKSEESALTGESVPSEKDASVICDEKAPLGDRKNMIYSGCSISYGACVAVVTATGMNTEVGKIANLLSEEKESATPLQQKLNKLGKILAVVALALVAVIFIVGKFVKGIELIEILMISISLAVSAIPEGLPAIVTIVLSLGVQKMVKRNAIIKKLPAVETLGGASVICSDKTGTLTQNKMTLVKAYVEGESCEVSLESPSQELIKLLQYSTLCCNGNVSIENDVEKAVGDPTETAIVSACLKAGFDKATLEQDYPRLYELPFDSDRKLMTTVNKINGKTIVITKGAYDILKTRCISGDFARADKIVSSLASDALRVLAVAYKEIDSLPQDYSFEDAENGLHFMGLVGMIDPPRPEAKEAVELCIKAGIKAVMITGDHIDTAKAIAKDLGILQEGDLALTGAQLDELSEEELLDKIEKISVYARVTPENKIRIVKAWQTKDQVVAMTGDGVNDAPALKAADIGCAMGITGTDVAKGAADMTLTDDNFSTLVHAVKEGRGIYSNIKKVVGFLLGTNIAEILIVFFAMMIFGLSPFISIQLLWINLVTDSLPAIALGMEKTEEDVMHQKPRKKKEGLFANGYGIEIIIHGCFIGALVLVCYLLGYYVFGSGGIANATDIQIEQAKMLGSTMAFLALAFCEIVQAYNMRSEHSIFHENPFGNKTLNIASLISLVLVVAVVLIPGVNTAFNTMLMPWQCYLVVVGAAVLVIVYMEIFKLIKKLVNKKSK